MILKLIYYIWGTLFLLFCHSITAQNIKGKIINEANDPIENVAVIMQTIDSTFVDATLSDSLGNFVINSNAFPHRLIFQHLLYKPLSKEYNNSNNNYIIQLKELSRKVEEVIIEGKKSNLMIENGALIYDFDNMAEQSSTSNVFDLIATVPLLIEQGENFKLIGSNSLSLLINGKISSMTDNQLINLLKSLPVSQLDKVEIMYSSPAKYRIQGASLNIVLKRDKSEESHLKGEIGVLYKQRNHFNTDDHVGLSFSNKKISADFLYSYSYFKKNQDFDLISNHLLNNKLYNINQIDKGLFSGNTHQMRTSLDYQITDNNNLNVAYTMSLEPDGKMIRTSKGNLSDAINIKTTEDRMHNVSVNFLSGFGLNTGIDYTSYHNPNIQDFKDNLSDVNSHFIANANQKINRLNIYAGETHNLKRNWNINYGFNMIFATDRSYQTYHTIEGEDLSPLNTEANIKETTINFYGGGEKSFGDKISFSFSFAGEFYQLKDYKKWSLFPTLQLGYKASENNSFQLSISSNKDYPSYWELQSSTSYINGYQKILGNPNLRPATNYNLQLSYILKNQYLINIYYSRIKDYFRQTVFQSPEELAMIYQTINYKYEQYGGITLAIPLSIGDRISSNLTIDGTVTNDVCDKIKAVGFNRTKIHATAILNNSLKVCNKPAISVDLNGMYISPAMDGLYNLSHIWKIDAGVNCTFASDKIQVKFLANDILNTAMPTMRVDFRTQNFKMTPKFDTRFISLSVVYRFGNFKEKQYKEIDRSRFGH